jgi:septal ring factor EnvC (AmiA/AmiB activator)
MKHKLVGIILGLSFCLALLSGCSNAPSKEELDQLEKVKSEITALEKKIGALEQQKLALRKSITEKEMKIEEMKKNKAALSK